MAKSKGKSKSSARSAAESPPSEVRSGQTFTLSDPAALALLGGGLPSAAGEFVSESTVLGLSAVWRSAMNIAGQLACLPLHTYKTGSDGSRTRARSFLDNPAGPDGVTQFEWVETVGLYLVLHGEAFLMHLYNAAGAIAGLLPIHPRCVGVERQPNAPEGKIFIVSMADGTSKKFTTREMTHVVGPCMDGLRGMSVMSFARNSLGAALAGDKAAAKMFAHGALISGVLTPSPEQMLSPEDVDAISADLRKHLYGTENAGSIPIVNRVLQFTPWTMSNEEAQWIESRQFSIQEVARWFGMPLHMLMVAGATSNWGTGIAEQNKNLSQYVLVPWGQRLTQRLSRLLRDAGTFVEFDFAGLEAGSAKDSSDLLLAEVNGGLRTVNEARRIKNLPPIPGGDELRVPSGVMLSAKLEADATAAAVDAVVPDALEGQSV